MNGDRVENHRMAFMLGLSAEKNGVMLLRMDYHGLGVSSGEYIETSVASKVEDILLSIEYLKGCLQHELRSVLILGFSDGAKVAVQVAKEVDLAVVLCLWNPVLFELSSDYLGLDSQKNNQNLKLTRDPVFNRLSYPLPYTGLLMNMKYLKELSTNSFDLDDLIQMDFPKMMFFGGADEKTKETKEKLLNQQFTTNPHHTLKLIEGADHLFSSCAWSEEIIKLTIEWALERTTKSENRY
ncbi:hypothetical protein [Paenibacillus sp. FSL K6-2524]|uniref:hypothetical protein n=1 Tax=Paenibacillus sp. FSL K6-2524 TaxID=2954516 RepID=UPI0030F629DC